MSRKSLLIISSVIVLGTVGFVLYNRARKQSEVDEILSFIDADRTNNLEKDPTGQNLFAAVFNPDILKKPIPAGKKGITMPVADLAKIGSNIYSILKTLPDTKWETYATVTNESLTGVPNPYLISLGSLKLQLDKITDRYSLVLMNESYKKVFKIDLLNMMIKKPFLYNNVNGIVSKFGFVIEGWNPYLRSYFSTLPDYSS